MLLAMLLLLAIAAGAIAAVIATSSSQTTVKLRSVVSSDVKQAAREISQLVSENTK